MVKLRGGKAGDLYSRLFAVSRGCYPCISLRALPRPALPFWRSQTFLDLRCISLTPWIKSYPKLPMFNNHTSGIRHKRTKDENTFVECLLLVRSQTDIQPPALQINRHRDIFIYSLQNNVVYVCYTWSFTLRDHIWRQNYEKNILTYEVWRVKLKYLPDEKVHWLY